MQKRRWKCKCEPERAVTIQMASHSYAHNPSNMIRHEIKDCPLEKDIGLSLPQPSLSAWFTLHYQLEASETSVVGKLEQVQCPPGVKSLGFMKVAWSGLGRYSVDINTCCISLLNPLNQMWQHMSITPDKIGARYKSSLPWMLEIQLACIYRSKPWGTLPQTRWKSRIKLPSELHMYAMAYTCLHSHKYFKK